MGTAVSTETFTDFIRQVLISTCGIYIHQLVEYFATLKEEIINPSTFLSQKRIAEFPFLIIGAATTTVAMNCNPTRR